MIVLQDSTKQMLTLPCSMEIVECMDSTHFERLIHLRATREVELRMKVPPASADIVTLPGKGIKSNAPTHRPMTAICDL